MRNLSDHALLVALALVSAELSEDAPAADVDARSTALNNEAVLRWGHGVTDELADLVTGAKMDADDFIGWAVESGRNWLSEQLIG